MIDREDTANLEALRREARAWVIRMRSGEATADDTAALVCWRARSPDHAQALSEAIRLRRLVAEAGRDLAASPSPVERFLQPAPRRRVIQPAISRRVLIGGTLAAVGAAMVVRPPLGLWPSLAELRSDYRTGTGERRMIVLAKGASVELNTRTSIALRSDDQAYRLELIAGEVAVDVVNPVRLVAVRTEAGEASASTGRFGVRIEGDQTCVTCLVGRVAVTDGDGRSTGLIAGQQLTYGHGPANAVVAIDTARAAAWRRGLLIFSDEPLSRVVDEVNRYRPGKIILTNADLGRIPVNAVFQLDRMDRAVSQIREVANASVTTLPGGVVLLG